MDMKKIKSKLNFAKNVFTTGALFETSRKVEVEICKKVPTDRDCIIVEYGMGLGNITREILNRVNANSKVYAFEINEKFCKEVREDIPDERLIIINDGAQTVKEHIQEPVDVVIASIPYSFFPKEVGNAIIQDSKDILREGGFYSQVLYAKRHIPRFSEIFGQPEVVRIKGFPTEYVFHCGKTN